MCIRDSNKFGVKTGVKDGNGDDVTIDLTMDSPLIRAQGFIELRILDNIFLLGNIAFELGPTEEVHLTNNSDAKTVTTMSIDAGDVTAFIGANGPYWTDLDKDHEVSWAFNTGSGNTASRTISAGTVVVGGTTYSASGTALLPVNTIVHLGKDQLL